MTAGEFAKLLAPGRIGGLTLANRVVLPGMDMNHCEDGVITEAEVDHYVTRAAGGCGLIITGAAAIAWPIGATSRKQPALGDDRFLPGLVALADGIHGAGSRLCVQLVHHGKVASVDTANERPQLVPSIPPSRMDLSALADNPMEELMRLASATGGKAATYQLATEDDIAWAIDRFADAAGRVQAAGADAVEIHGAHGYLISTFLSRAYNQRTDRYGGPLENRSRLLVEVIRAVRRRVGDGFPILVRLNGCEYGIDDGITIDETVETAVIAEAAGADAIHVSANAANPFGDFTLGPLPAELAQYRTMAAAVKHQVSIPVIAVGRLLPETAEEMLANHECDFVSMGRQQLADPELVNKIASGRRKSVRPCINCYVCVEQNFFDSSPVCAVNPALGAPLGSAVSDRPSPKHVVVVGGGPAGLEVARAAAERGHRVSLLERSERLGGSTWFAELSGSPNQALVDWLVHETSRPEITLHLANEATIESILAIAPDVVVIATGSTPLRLEDGSDAAALVQLLSSADCAPQSLAIVGGGMIGVSLSTYLAEHRHRVTVLEAGPHFGLGMAMPRRWTAVGAARSAGVELVRNAVVELAGPKFVRYVIGDNQAIDLAVDHMIFADVGDSGAWSRDSEVDCAADSPAHLADGLRSMNVDVHLVGDVNRSIVGSAARPRHLHGAIHSANALVASL